MTWTSAEPPVSMPIGLAGWSRVVLRGGAISLVILVCLAVLLGLRLVEVVACRGRRRWTPALPRLVCRVALSVLRLPVHVTGRPEPAGAVVANHAGWLDIFVLNAARRITFIAKSEVAGWPGIGILARVTGTLFIRRDRRQADAQRAAMRERLDRGETLLFFPEGTSTDGRRVLGFKTTLFQALLDHPAPDLAVQPVSLIFHAPPRTQARFYGWWGDMAFGPHLLRVLAAHPQGRVDLIWHPPLTVAAFSRRKTLAAACEQAVRQGHAGALD